jgi:hypothetical protein
MNYKQRKFIFKEQYTDVEGVIPKGSEIILFRYYNDKKELRFRLQYQKYEDKLTDVYPKKSNVLTVCVLFISGENQVELGYIKQGKLN